jgi:hypothetical protein
MTWIFEVPAKKIAAFEKLRVQGSVRRTAGRDPSESRLCGGLTGDQNRPLLIANVLSGAVAGASQAYKAPVKVATDIDP